jgi:hypothetical protein
MISPEETGILYSSRVLDSRTRLNQGLCGTPGKQSSRMLKKAVSKAAASEDRRRTLWGTLRI